MNVPIYIKQKAKLHSAAVIFVLLLMPITAFTVGYFLNGYDIPIATLAGLFGLAMMGAVIAIFRKSIARDFTNKPAFVLKDEAIETSSGEMILWKWFDRAIVFTCEDRRMLGLRKRSNVEGSAIENSTFEFGGMMFGLPFAIQFDQFATSENEIIKLFQTKLPVVLSNVNFYIGEGIDWEKIDE